MKRYALFGLGAQRRVVRLGWRWPGFFLSFLWLWYRRCWLMGFGVLVVAIAGNVVFLGIGTFAASVWAAAGGTAAERQRLHRRGWGDLGEVEVPSPEAVAASNSPPPSSMFG